MSANYGLYTANYKLRPALYSNIVLNMRIKHLGIGLKIGSNSISTVNMNVVSFSGNTYDRYMYAENATQVSLLFNRYAPCKFGHIYFGVAPGIIAYTNRDANTVDLLHPGSLLASVSGFGYTAGGQFGCNVRLGRRVDLNFEAGMQYVHITAQQQSSPSEFPLSYLTYPITAGAKYKFAIGKKYKNVYARNPQQNNEGKSRKVKKEKTMHGTSGKP